MALSIVVDPVARRRGFEVTRRLVRSHRLTTYDAAYLELALPTGVPLATLDARLLAAAKNEGVGRYLGG